MESAQRIESNRGLYELVESQCREDRMVRYVPTVRFPPNGAMPITEWRRKSAGESIVCVSDPTAVCMDSAGWDEANARECGPMDDDCNASSSASLRRSPQWVDAPVDCSAPISV